MRAAALTTSAFLLFVAPAMSVEIDSTVRDVSGKNATVVTQSDLVPNTGDEVEIFFKMPGTGDEITVGTGRVSEAGVDSIEVTIQEASGAVEKNHLARIYSDSPTKKGAAPPPRAATGLGQAKPTNPDGKAAKQLPVSPETENGVQTARREAVVPSGERGIGSPVMKSADIDTDCRADLERLGAAVLAYRIIHNDKNPAKFSDLYYDGLVESLGDFTCAAASAETASEIDAKTDYTLESLPDTKDLLVREKAPREGTNKVLAIFTDGAIKPVNVAAAPTTTPAVTKTPQLPPLKKRARIEPPAPPVANQTTVAAPGADAASYLGCFRDQGTADSITGRDLDGAMRSDGGMTSAMCIDACRAQGFAYAGTQYYSYCFCGNRYGASGPADNCNTPCAGNPDEICGGGWANSVYATGITASPIAGPAIGVQTATYGENCGAPVDNVTDHAKQTCDEKADCDYRVDAAIIGDPVPGCAKDYVIGWTCGAKSQLHYLNAEPEAGLGSVLRLSCPPPEDAITERAPPGTTTPDQPPVAGEPTQPLVATRQSSASPPDEHSQQREQRRSAAIANRVAAKRVTQVAAGLDQARAAIDDLVAQNRALAAKLRTIEARLTKAESRLDLGLAESARSTARDALRYASDYGRDVFKLHSLGQAEQQAKELSARSSSYGKLLEEIQAQTAQRHEAAEENFARYTDAVAKLSEVDDTRREQALSDLAENELTEQARSALALIRDQLAQYQRTRRAEPEQWKLAFKERFEAAAD